MPNLIYFQNMCENLSVRGQIVGRWYGMVYNMQPVYLYRVFGMISFK